MSFLPALPAIFGGGAAAAGGGGSLFSTLAAVGTAAGTGISAYSQFSAAKAARQAGEAQNDAAKIRARQALDEGRERASRMSDDNRRRLAAMRARMAAGGTSLSGSALDFLGEAARRLETQTQDAFRQSALDSRAELYSGQMAQWQGGQAGSASALRGFGTLLEGTAAYGAKRMTGRYGLG